MTVNDHISKSTRILGKEFIFFFHFQSYVQDIIDQTIKSEEIIVFLVFYLFIIFSVND
jgi:hypothetical protein